MWADNKKLDCVGFILLRLTNIGGEGGDENDTNLYLT